MMNLVSMWDVGRRGCEDGDEEVRRAKKKKTDGKPEGDALRARKQNERVFVCVFVDIWGFEAGRSEEL